MRAYSMDLRTRVLADLDAGMPPKDAAAKYSVSVAWARRLRQRHRESGETAPRPAGRRPRKLAGEGARIRSAVASRPDATLPELKAELGLAVSLATLCREIIRLGLTVKKKSSGPPSKTAPT
jgi:transposase